MNKKKVLALLLVMAVMSTVALPPKEITAAGLTQAIDPSTVNYGELKSDEIELLKAVFDKDYYLEQNPDLKWFKDDYDELFEHFCKCGIFEGRACSPNFDPSAYASAYPDLKDAFGKDIFQYYKHFITKSAEENRTITTLEGCVLNGITVEPLAVENVKIYPETYWLCKTIGITDYATMQKIVIDSVNYYQSMNDGNGGGNAGGTGTSGTGTGNANGTASNTKKATYSIYSEEKPVVIAFNDVNIVLANELAFENAYEKAKSLPKINCTITAENKCLSFFVVKGQSGYALVNNDGSLARSTPIEEKIFCKTDDFVATEDVDGGEILNYDIIQVEDASDLYRNIDSAVYYNNYKDLPVSHREVRQSAEDNREGNYIEYDRLSSLEEGTDMTSVQWRTSGYYSNEDGTEYHLFTSEEDRAAYAETNTRYEFHQEYYVDNDDRKHYYSVDKAGTDDSVYNVGMNINVNEQGEIESYEVGVYNDETQFGSYHKCDVPYVSGDYSYSEEADGVHYEIN